MVMPGVSSAAAVAGEVPGSFSMKRAGDGEERGGVEMARGAILFRLLSSRFNRLIYFVLYLVSKISKYIWYIFGFHSANLPGLGLIYGAKCLT
jgi:hypothetical protein